MRYSDFMPRLYNLALSLGFSPGRIMPSRAFCSDESQGYPIILIAKHFGTFPFNHGRVGGIVSTDRHGPHAHHGRDLVLIHASHVGYEADTGVFGHYRRLQTEGGDLTTSCGKLCAILHWYQEEYRFARENIHLLREGDSWRILIDNLLLHSEREEGLVLRLEHLVRQERPGELHPLRCFSTAKLFDAVDGLAERLGFSGMASGERRALGERLAPELFGFRRRAEEQAEKNLLEAMPFIVTSPWPALTAAQVNTQVEFDRAYRSILREPEYQGRNLLFISGLNVDISPREGQLFPLTKFIPWAAYLQREEGEHEVWEQEEIWRRLMAQSVDNPHQVTLEEAIEVMRKVPEIRLRVP
ncbi:MAG TPA: hypothetical protein EYP90_02640, partial [Chromatiaceae bacterium]|nr:hypothetical protein [Chromatiaceae bacterium]